MLLISLRLLTTLFFDLIYIIGLPKMIKSWKSSFSVNRSVSYNGKSRRLPESLIRKEYCCQL